MVTTHKVLDRMTRMVLHCGTYRDCCAFARAFGLCCVEEV